MLLFWLSILLLTVNVELTTENNVSYIVYITVERTKHDIIVSNKLSAHLICSQVI